MSRWRRTLDNIAHRLWDTADWESPRGRLGNRLCWIATEWPGFRHKNKKDRA